MKTLLKSTACLILAVFIAITAYTIGLFQGSWGTSWRVNGFSIKDQLKAADLIRQNQPQAALQSLEANNVDKGLFLGRNTHVPVLPDLHYFFTLWLHPTYAFSANYSSLKLVQEAGDAAREYSIHYPDYTRKAEQDAAANP